MSELLALICELFGFDEEKVHEVQPTHETRYVVKVGRVRWWCDLDTGDAHVIDYEL